MKASSPTRLSGDQLRNSSTFLRGTSLSLIAQYSFQQATGRRRLWRSLDFIYRNNLYSTVPCWHALRRASESIKATERISRKVGRMFRSSLLPKSTGPVESRACFDRHGSNPIIGYSTVRPDTRAQCSDQYRLILGKGNFRL